jgi:hypothetical protein
MLAVNDEPQLETQTGDTGIQCEAYDDENRRCPHEAKFWLEVYRTNKIIAVCPHHAEDWKEFALKQSICSHEWLLYPMGE